MKTLILICFAFSLSACSNNSDQKTAARMMRLEKEIDSLNSAIRIALIKPDTIINTISMDTKLDLIKKEYESLLSTNSWYKGRGLPFEPILRALEKSYNINDFDTWSSSTSEYKNTTQILLPNKWNMEDVNKIKDIVMKTFSFEPKIDKNRQGEIDELTWTGSIFDIEIYESGSSHIGIYFFLK